MKNFKNTVITLILIMGCVTLGKAQSNLDDYKYIIVSKKYDFLKLEDQYQLNSLTAFLYKKHGFLVLMEGDAYPNDLEKGICLALNSNVIANSGMFKIKLQIELKNCKNEIVFTSREGTSREKKFKVAYNLALRDAFKSFDAINYSYVPNEKEDAAIAIAKKQDITQEEQEQIKTDIKELKKTNENTEIIPKKELEILTITTDESKNLLYAQPIEAGFQIVDSTPKVVMILLETPLEKTFIVKNENAIIYWQDGFWYMSKNDGQKILVEPLNIKF